MYVYFTDLIMARQGFIEFHITHKRDQSDFCLAFGGTNQHPTVHPNRHIFILVGRKASFLSLRVKTPTNVRFELKWAGYKFVHCRSSWKRVKSGNVLDVACVTVQVEHCISRMCFVNKTTPLIPSHFTEPVKLSSTASAFICFCDFYLNELRKAFDVISFIHSNNYQIGFTSTTPTGCIMRFQII